MCAEAWGRRQPGAVDSPPYSAHAPAACRLQLLRPLWGARTPSCMCSWFVLRQWAGLPAGLGHWRGRVIPSRHCHQPPPTSPVPAWQGQPPLPPLRPPLHAAGRPHPHSVQFPAPPSGSPPSSCFSGRVCSHSGPQPQPARSSGQTEVSPGASSGMRVS